MNQVASNGNYLLELIIFYQTYYKYLGQVIISWMIQKINFKDNSRQTNAYDGYEVTPINNNNQAYLNETSNNLGLQQNNVYPNQTIPINNMNQMNMMGNFGGLMGLGQKSANPFIIDPRRFTYNGNQIGYNTKIAQIQQPQLINQAILFINGNQVGMQNKIAYTCVIFWGALLILPLFILCFDCFKRSVSNIFEISPNFYASLQNLSRNGNLQSLTLLVKDNNFDRNKAQILYNVLRSNPALIGFTFINYAQCFDYKQSEYSDFIRNMQQIKKLGIITDLRWGREVVQLS